MKQQHIQTNASKVKEELLREIDDVIKFDGIWQGGRLDTIKWLVNTVIDRDCNTKARENQVGGDHYKKFKIQPYEFFEANRDVISGNQAITMRYILRYRYKNGVEDLKKARDMIDKLIEWEEW